MEYELTTIADIFNKVPTDRIELCCAELGQVLKCTKATAEAMIALADLSGVPDAKRPLHELIKLPLPLVWKDNGLGVIKTEFEVAETGEAIGTLLIQPKPLD